jgi:hypothetical protein
MGKMFFNILATFAEFEVDLLRLRTREGMAIARAKGKLRGRQPKLSSAQQAHLIKLHGSGEHSIAELAELLGVATNGVPGPRARPAGVTLAPYPKGPRGEPRAHHVPTACIHGLAD